MMQKKNRLSIGDVSKLKNVSIKSLRYYDRIGVLKPEYTDPQTHYRYYSSNQLYIADILWILTILDIPLKRFNDFRRNDGSYEVEKLTEQAEKRLAEKQAELKLAEEVLASVRESTALFDEAVAICVPRVKHCSNCCLLTAPCNETQLEPVALTIAARDLYAVCRKRGYSYSYRYGVLCRCENGKRKLYYAIEMTANSEDAAHNDDVYILPEGEYICSVIDDPFTDNAPLDGIASNEFYLRLLYDPRKPGEGFLAELLTEEGKRGR